MRNSTTRVVLSLLLLTIGSNLPAYAQIHVKSALDRAGVEVPLADPAGETVNMNLNAAALDRIAGSIDANVTARTMSITKTVAGVTTTTTITDDPADCKTPDPATGEQKPLTFRRWRPASQSAEHARCYWAQGGREFVKATNLSGSGGTVANTTEIVSDLQGPTRLAFSTAVVGTTDDGDDDDAEQNAAERSLNLLRTNGGNLAFSGVYPVFVDRWGPTTFVAHGFGRAGANMQALGGATTTTSVDWKDLNGSAEISMEVRALMNSDAETFRFVAFARPGIVAGTKSFNEALGNRKRTALFGGEVGLIARIGNLFSVGLSWTRYTEDLPGSGGAIHFSFGQ